MGSTKGFGQLVKKWRRAANVIELVKGKRIGIDLSGILHRVQAGSDVKHPGQYLKTFLDLACKILAYGALPIFVFDGPVMAGEKKVVLGDRKKARLQNLLLLGRAMFDVMTKSCELDEGSDLVEQRKRLRGEIEVIINYIESDGGLSERELQEEIIRLAQEVRGLTLCDITEIEARTKRIISISSIHFQELKRMFDMCGISYIEAVGEADWLLAKLAHFGVIDIVMSNDIDMVMYGCPIVIGEFDMRGGSEVVVTVLNEVIAGLSADKGVAIRIEQFMDVAIICGTDYTPKEALWDGIGPAKALDLIIKHGSIEKVLEAHPKFNKAEFNYREVREYIMNTYVAPLPDETPKPFSGLQGGEDELVAWFKERTNYMERTVRSRLNIIKTFKN